MKIIVGELSGFCAGVTYTVNKAKDTLKEHGKVYCLGEIVHNEKVIEMLENLGMITVNDISEVPVGAKVIFRAHGEAEAVYEKAKERNLDVLDLTCGKVRRIHLDVHREKKDKFIIITGKGTHPETIGTKGFAGDSSIVIGDESEIEDAILAFNKSNLNTVYIVSQTTFSSAKFKDITEKIKERLNGTDVIVNNTICDATENRQKEVETLSKDVDKMIIIGGKNSSNTKELADIAKKNCEDVYLVQEKTDLKDVSFNDSDAIGLVSGASTPKETVNEIYEYIKNRR